MWQFIGSAPGGVTKLHASYMSDAHMFSTGCYDPWIQECQSLLTSLTCMPNKASWPIANGAKNACKVGMKRKLTPQAIHLHEIESLGTKRVPLVEIELSCAAILESNMKLVDCGRLHQKAESSPWFSKLALPAKPWQLPQQAWTEMRFALKLAVLHDLAETVYNEKLLRPFKAATQSNH